MSTGQPHGLLDLIRQWAAGAQTASVNDAQLLKRFSKQKDRGAFELLVRRHGPMVLATCRRILRDEHRAEDAFQAVIIVLLRHAGRVGWRECVGAWLYKVAFRIALRAREAQAARAARERPIGDAMETSGSLDDNAAESGELLEVLDEEIRRLPARCQRACVLCWLEGKSPEEAATELGSTAHRVHARLQYARQKLRSRLTRRGYTVGAMAVPTVLSAQAAQAVVPPAFVAVALQAAAAVSAGQVLTGAVGGNILALANGSAIVTAKSKTVVAALVMAGLSMATAGAAIGFGWFSKPSANARPDEHAQATTPVMQLPQRPGDAVKKPSDARTPRQRLLEESCVPRLIADLQSIGGKATKESATVDDDYADAVLSWSINPLSKTPTRVRVRYDLHQSIFLMWRDGGDGDFHLVDPEQPIYLELWPHGPKMVLGTSQAQDMEEALAGLKD